MAAGELSDPRRPGTGPAPPDDMREHVRAAYAMLCDANKRAIQVPADVVSVITTARKAAAAELPPDLEARFWNAYGLLSSSIKPAEHARRFYRGVFYCVLASLLLFQFVYTAGDHLRTKLAEVEKQIVDVRGRAATPPSQQAAGTPAAASAAITPESADAVTRQLQQSRIAYHRLSADLVAFVSKPIDWIGGFDEFYTTRRSLAATTARRRPGRVRRTTRTSRPGSTSSWRSSAPTSCRCCTGCSAPAPSCCASSRTRSTS
jgi:hypothetical protein